MTRIAAAIAAAAALALAGAATAGAGGWTSQVPVTSQVASSPTTGGGYPDPSGAPQAGTCTRGPFDANHSESWLAVQPGTENLVGASKFFFDRYSTFYNFYLGAYEMPNGKPSGDNQVQGYDCVSTGTQAMPPSWTNTTDPNVAWDLHGRVYQTMLPFNAFWTNLHPSGAIDVSYSDDGGAHWTKGNGGKDLDFSNSSSFTFGHVDDKQWVAVDDNSPFADSFSGRVYAVWALFNGYTVQVKIAYSTDRGQTFSAPATLTPPNETGPSTTYVIPSVDAAGNLYVAVTSFPACCSSPATISVSHSSDGGASWAPFTQVAQTATVNYLPNTRFRDGITESFAASPTYPDHVYLAYEKWDGTQMDVAGLQSTDGGTTWTPLGNGIVNDNVDGSTPTDQFQPAVAAGPNGAVAVAFYDRRQPCPTNDKSILPADQGRANFCIDTSLQAYKDSGSGAVPVGGNVRISKYTWDPEQPGQKVGGLDQYPCAGATDPCPQGDGFIGDYFGLAISDNDVYALSVSTHYPSDVQADGGGPVYYQQQILATVARSAYGSGY